MRINIFDLKKKHQDWEEVKRELHYAWIGNSSVALPMWCDSEFQKAFKEVKRKKTLNDMKKILGLP